MEFDSNMLERFATKRKGALGAITDFYEYEVDILIKTINERVKDEYWDIIVDKLTEDKDCRSIKSICEHLVRSGNHYIELMKKGEDENHQIKKIHSEIVLKEDFEPAMRDMLSKQIQYLENKWEWSDKEIEKVVIKTVWGNILDIESLLEHAVLHVMRHHRQILKYVRICGKQNN